VFRGPLWHRGRFLRIRKTKKVTEALRGKTEALKDKELGQRGTEQSKSDCRSMEAMEARGKESSRATEARDKELVEGG